MKNLNKIKLLSFTESKQQTLKQKHVKKKFKILIPNVPKTVKEYEISLLRNPRADTT